MGQEVKLLEAYARLKALKAHLPDERFIAIRYGDEFCDILTLLQEISGHDLTNFRMPPSAMVTPQFGVQSYDRNFLLVKIDGLINFFEIQWSDPKPPIGFAPQ